MIIPHSLKGPPDDQESALAKHTTTRNGHDRLDEAMAMLIQDQAAFVSQMSETERLHMKFERETT
jgi:hypothetical protein